MTPISKPTLRRAHHENSLFKQDPLKGFIEQLNRRGFFRRDFSLQNGGTKVAKQLNVGGIFPDFQLQTVDGRELHLPQDLTGEYSILIFYRGIW